VTPKGHHFPPFRLDTVNQCLWRGTDQISLSPKAFSVLLHLADRRGRLVTKQELLDAIWPDIHVTEGVLKRAVLEIRKALDDPVEEPRFIQTLHRRGYRFLSGEFQAEPAAEEPAADNGIVGRAREFQQLDQWFGAAVESSRQMVFISGEAGMGKTTLVETWLKTLRRRGGAIASARGRCLQQFGSGEPFLPVFEALEQLSQALGRRLVEHLRSRAPTWLLHMPALISLEDRAKLRDEVFGSTRERMLREITDALEALSGESPIVLALEDLHWSDPSTIDLLSSIARRTSPARLMILATYRPGDAGGSYSPLLGAQNELQLHRQCQVLPLGYLSKAATGEYLEGRFGMDSPDLAAALHRRTNGNPLYVVSLIDELDRMGSMNADPTTIQKLVPETLQQMFERQAVQLSGAEQEMLDVAAACGEAFSVAAVAEALGRDAGDVESACETLVRRHLILKRSEMFRFPDGGESAGYAFVHALCRDALYRRIPPGRRSRLHGQLGRAEEQLYSSDPKRIAGQLAGHFELAGDISRAIRYLRMASDVATGRYSNQEAAQYLERAFALIDRLPEADRPSCRMDLLEQRAMVRLVGSDMRGSVADFRALADEARAVGAADRHTRALVDITAPMLFVDWAQIQPALDEAQAAQSASPDSALSAMANVNRAFFQIYFHGWDRESADLFGAASRKAAELDELRYRSRIAWMRASLLCFSGEYAAAAESAEQARQIARKANLPFDYFVTTMYLNWALVHRGDLGYALRVARDGAQMAAKNGSRIPMVWFIVRQNWVRMEAFHFEGAMEPFERDPTMATGLSPRASSFPMYVWLATARLGKGDVEGAWEALEKVREVYEGGGMAFQSIWLLLNTQMECELARKNFSSAKEFALRLLRTANEHSDHSYAARAYRLLAEVAVGQGDHQVAAEHIAQAQASLERCEAWTVEWRVYATAAHVFARLGRHTEAADARERSRKAAQRVAESLADEAELRASLLQRVTADLGEISASA